MSSQITIYPTTGSGGLAAHTPVGDTPNWKCVDETPSDDDTTYVLNSALGVQLLTDRYGMGDSTGQIGIINSVTSYINVRVSTVGVTQEAWTVLRTQSTTYEGTHNDITLDVTYALYSKAYTTNPNTLAAWTWTQVNAVQSGVSTSVNIADVRCTQVYAVVDYDDGYVPSDVALITITGLQPEFVEPQNYFPDSVATVTASGLQPEFIEGQNYAADAVATITTSGLQPDFRQAELPEHVGLVFDLRSRVPVKRGLSS